MYHLNEGDAPLVAVGYVVSHLTVSFAATLTDSTHCTCTFELYSLFYPICSHAQVGLDYSNPHLSPFKEFQVSKLMYLLVIHTH